LANILERQIDGESGVRGNLRRGLGTFFVLLVAVWSVGCAGPKPLPPAFAEPIEQPKEYVIGASDQLKVSVWKNPELSVDGVPVRPDGKISLPLVGDVEAAGKTAEELEEIIVATLEEYVSNPNVAVVVTVINSYRAFVLGEVGAAGPVVLSSRLRVLDAISARGGFSAFADKRHVKIIRKTPEGEAQYIFDYKAYIKGKAPESNVVLQAGDTIIVPD